MASTANGSNGHHDGLGIQSSQTDGSHKEMSFAEAAASAAGGDVNLDQMPVESHTIDGTNGQRNGNGKNSKQEGLSLKDNATATVPKPIEDPKQPSPPGSVSFADAVKMDPPPEKKQPKHKKSTTNGKTNGNSKRDKEKSGSHPDRRNGVRRTGSDSPQRVRWAPLNLPLRRRLQTMAVLLHSSILLISVPVFLFICAIPLSWPFLIPYFLHVLLANAATDGKLSWRSEWWRSLGMWSLFAEYFPARLHKTHDLPADRKYIFGYHPHGIISHGAWAAFATNALGFAEKFPGITNSLLTLESNFNIPIYREYLLFAGLRSVSRTSIKNILSKGGKDGKGQGRAVTVVVGGARESLSAQPGTMRLILQDRVGFIKMAIRTGADIVPVLCFGETSLYDQLSGHEHPRVHKFQMFVLRVWKFTLPFLHGRGVFNYDYGMMPYRHPMNVVVGKPIPVQASENDIASPEEVQRVHGLYCDELQKLWDTYKDEFAKDREEEMLFLKSAS